MGEAVKDSFYVPLDITSAVNEFGKSVQSGESCRVTELKDTYAWMRGFVNGWYGWANDGKGTFLDFMCLLKAKYDGWKFCLYKHEDMDTVIIDKRPMIKANRIYKNLAWSLTGKTWNKNFADRMKCKAMTLEEEMEALEFISKHFFVINPPDRKFRTMLDCMMFMYEKYGIDAFVCDPWNVVQLPENERGDIQLINAFIDVKEFTMKTNSVFNIVNHARSMQDVKEKDGRYKVVNQFMQLGGSAWDIKLDGQYSIYRPERHLDPKDTKVHLYNLKQRQAEIVGVDRGVYEKIKFDKIRKQYYFSGVNPMNGHIIGLDNVQTEVAWNVEPKKASNDEDDLPF